MHIEMIDRAACKAQAQETLRTAQVPARLFTLLYLVIVMVLGLIVEFAAPGLSILSAFVSILGNLTITVLAAGFILYCMDIRRGERAEYLTLFDGFSMVGRIIGLTIVTNICIALWSMLFVIPGIIAAYRYQFAMLNLLENPELGIMEALNLSKRQTLGYKSQLFLLDLSYLGWSLLATVPMMCYATYTASQVLSGAAYLPPEGIVGVLASAGGGSIVVFLLTGLWTMAVQLFYLPNYQCVQLAYFDIAKRTSGVSPLPGSTQGGGCDGYHGGYHGGTGFTNGQ